MKLMTLTIRNFQGIESLVLDPQGENLDIYGDNGTGKTTVASALSWLLTGKDSLGRGDFSIKPLDSDGNERHNLESLVEGIYEHEGRELVLQKVFHEVYTKKRGNTRPEFTGNTVDHFVNGVPVAEKDFKVKVEAVASAEQVRLLTDPSYFPEGLHWLKRRTVLLDLAQGVTDESVIAANPELDSLPAILNGNTVAEHRKVIASSRKKINENLQALPVRIDEARRAIVDPVDTAADEALCDELRTQIHELQADAVRLATGGQAGELRSRIREAESAVNTAKSAMENAARTKAVDDTILANASRQTALQSVEAARTALSNARAAVTPIEAKHKAAGDEVDRLNTRLYSLKAAWATINAETFDGDTHCPTCQQALPPDQVDAARGNWNQSRAERLALNVSTGTETKSALNLAATTFDTLDAELTTARTAVTTAEQTLATAEAAVPAPIVIQPTFADTPEMLAAAETLKTLQDTLANLNTDTTERDRVNTELTQARTNLQQAEERIAAARQAEKACADAETRVSKLEMEEKRLGNEYIRLENELNLLDQFERAQAAQLEAEVNDRFRLARFKLFREQLNGGLEPCCEVLAGPALAPYNSGLNNGMRIAVGLDIIHTLGQHYGLHMPVIVDNAESVTCLPDIDAQVIRLIVSEADKTLRVEHARASKGVAA